MKRIDYLYGINHTNMKDIQKIEFYIYQQDWLTLDEIYALFPGYRYSHVEAMILGLVNEGFVQVSSTDNVSIRYSLNMQKYEPFINALGGKRVRRIGQSEQDTKAKSSNHIYDSNRATGLKLFEQMQQKACNNQGVVPHEYHEPGFICETCGNGADGVAYEHPVTGNCFVCCADDWIDATCWHAGIRGDQYVKIMMRLGK